MHFNFRYPTLSSKLYHQQQPSPLIGAKAGHFNIKLAQDLGWSKEEQENWIKICSGQQTFEECPPLAMVYAGHQFGHWAGQLGDGRGLLIAQIQDTKNQTIDLHLKGAGKTPYSRMGDGRAVLRSVIREYLAGHALNALGIPSSNAVGFTTSRQGVQREKLEPGAMMLRTADSHIRLGHFEWINQYQPELLKEFVQKCIEWHYPECLQKPEPILAFATKVIQRTATLVAHWQLVGFAHGVMNTDNLNITGSTLDFGPYGFMERFRPNWMNNHSDQQRRYTYQNQPRIALWNLNVWLHQLLPLVPHHKQALLETLEHFEPQFLTIYQTGLTEKMGLPTFHHQSFDCALAFLQLLQENQLDYTQSFIHLQEKSYQVLQDECITPVQFLNFLKTYQEIRSNQNIEQLDAKMCQVNPRYILRNHMLQHAIEQAEHDDFSEVERLFCLVTTPYTPQPNREQATDLLPPSSDMPEIAISCSS